jgi:hypothetical protein
MTDQQHGLQRTPGHVGRDSDPSETTQQIGGDAHGGAGGNQRPEAPGGPFCFEFLRVAFPADSPIDMASNLLTVATVVRD